MIEKKPKMIKFQWDWDESLLKLWKWIKEKVGKK